MTWTAVFNTIRTRFRNLVENDILFIPVQVIYDNEDDEPPDPGTELAKWFRFSILPAQDMQVSIGSTTSRRFRQSGLAVAQLFHPVGFGDGLLLTNADNIAIRFRAVTDAGVTFRTPKIVRVGRTGPWYQVNVEMPFWADSFFGVFTP